MLSIILGMAISCYKYDPKKERSEVPEKIEIALKVKGITLSSKTIRKYLKEATDKVDIEQ